jgi:hypothetical protein
LFGVGYYDDGTAEHPDGDEPMFPIVKPVILKGEDRSAKDALRFREI